MNTENTKISDSFRLVLNLTNKEAINILHYQILVPTIHGRIQKITQKQ